MNEILKLIKAAAKQRTRKFSAFALIATQSMPNENTAHQSKFNAMTEKLTKKKKI